MKLIPNKTLGIIFLLLISFNQFVSFTQITTVRKLNRNPDKTFLESIEDNWNNYAREVCDYNTKLKRQYNRTNSSET